MSRKTVLEYVQQCLSIMESDLVDSIDDTAESEQVAELLKDTYYDLLERQDWSFLYQPIKLTAAGDTDQPTRFDIPEQVRHIERLRYDVSDQGDSYEPRTIQWLEPEDFIERFSTSGDNRELVSVGDMIEFYVTNNKQPTFFTSFDNDSVFFDSYDSSLNTTLVGSKLRGYGVVIPTFSVQDNYTPDIPDHMVQLLQHELNSSAHWYFKQQPSQIDERKRRTLMGQARRRQDKLTRENYYAFRNGR